MKHIKAIITLMLIFIVLYFAQINIFTAFTIAGVMPNVFIIFALFMGLFLGKKQGVAISLFIGIILDMLIRKNNRLYGNFFSNNKFYRRIF